LQRDDVLVPDDKLNLAASALLDSGWIASTNPLPTQRYWQSGWKVVGQAGRTFQHPAKYDCSLELLIILPIIFVGLDPNPVLDSPSFARTMDNIWYPSAQLLAVTIVRTAIRRASKGTVFYDLMASWAAYFYAYVAFNRNSMDDEDDEVRS
jgi:hypothetical protein